MATTMPAEDDIFWGRDASWGTPARATVHLDLRRGPAPPSLPVAPDMSPLSLHAAARRAGPCCLRRAGGCAGPSAPFACRAAATPTAATPAAPVGYGPGAASGRSTPPRAALPSRAGYAWPLPCPVPLVGDGREGAAPPPRPAFAALAELRRSRLAAVPGPACRGREGRRAVSTSRPATPLHRGTLHYRPPLRPAALARCRILHGPCSTAGCVRQRRG